MIKGRTTLLIGIVLLAACAPPAVVPRTHAQSVRPVTQITQLVGRWKIVAVNGMTSQGFWMDFSPTAIQVFIACSSGSGGWSLANGQILLEPLRSPERDCTLPDAGPLPQAVRHMLGRPLEAGLTGPERLLLSNDEGRIDLIRVVAKP